MITAREAKDSAIDFNNKMLSGCLKDIDESIKGASSMGGMSISFSFPFSTVCEECIKKLEACGYTVKKLENSCLEYTISWGDAT